MSKVYVVTLPSGEAVQATSDRFLHEAIEAVLGSDPKFLFVKKDFTLESLDLGKAFTVKGNGEKIRVTVVEPEDAEEVAEQMAELDAAEKGLIPLDKLLNPEPKKDYSHLYSKEPTIEVLKVVTPEEASAFAGSATTTTKSKGSWLNKALEYCRDHSFYIPGAKVEVAVELIGKRHWVTLNGSKAYWFTLPERAKALADQLEKEISTGAIL